MRKYALIDNNIVTSIESLTEEQATQKSSEHAALIDIEDIIPQPQVGWFLMGNELKQKTIEMLSEEFDLYQQTTQRQFGEKLAKTATDLIGARNFKLARDGVLVDVATLATQMLSAKILLEGGALKTVKGLCGIMRLVHTRHQDIFDYIVSEINAFLAENNF